MKSLWGAAFALVLIGCQGQSPFERNENPIKDYPGVVAAANQKYDPNHKVVNPPDPDNSQEACYEPFGVKVENDQGNLLLSFSEGTESTYTIDIFAHGGNDFSVTPIGLPQGARFTQISKSGASAQFALTWKPPQIRYGQVTNTLISLRFQSTWAQRCGGDIREQLNLQVVKASDAPTVISAPAPTKPAQQQVEKQAQQVAKKAATPPTISFKGFPQKQIKFGDSFKFRIEINDPNSSPTSGPDLDKPVFDAQAAGKDVLDASEAIDCKSPGRSLGGKKWIFSCKFDSNLINNDSLKPLLYSGKTAEAGFFESAISKREQVRSADTPSPHVRIAFQPKPDTTAEKKTDSKSKKSKSTSNSDQLPVKQTTGFIAGDAL